MQNDRRDSIRVALILCALGTSAVTGAMIALMADSGVQIAFPVLGGAVILGIGHKWGYGGVLAFLAGVLGIVLMGLSSERGQSGMILLTTLSWMILFSVFWYRRCWGAWDLFSAFSYFCATFLVAFVLKGAQMIVQGAYTDDLVVGALSLINIGFIAYLGGYASALGVKIESHLRPFPVTWSTTKLKWVSIMLFLCGVLIYRWLASSLGYSGYMDVLSHASAFRRASGSEGRAYFLYTMLIVLTVPYLLWFASFVDGRTRRSRLHVVRMGIWLGTLFILIFPLAMRHFIVTLVLSQLVIYHYSVKPIPISILSLSTFLLAFYAVVMGLYRSLTLHVGGGVDALLYVVQETLKNFPTYVLGLLWSWFNALPTFVDMVAKLDLEDFTWGSTIVSMLLRPIPRAWFPGKPVETGTLVTRLLYPQIAAQHVAVNPSVFGEMYLNGGLIAIVLGLALLGILTRVVDEYRRKYPKNPAVISYHAVILIFPASVLTGGFDSNVWILFPMYTLAFIVITRFIQKR